MRELWLDFEQEPPARQRPGRVVLAVAVLAAALVLLQRAEIADRLEQTRAEVTRLQQAQALRAGNAPGADGAPADSASMPQWEKMLTALEVAADDSVTLLTLQTEGHDLRITGEARNLPAALDYAQRLDGSQAFAGTHLAHSEVVRDHPRQPVRFVLLAGRQDLPP